MLISFLIFFIERKLIYLFDLYLLIFLTTHDIFILKALALLAISFPICPYPRIPKFLLKSSPWKEELEKYPFQFPFFNCAFILFKFISASSIARRQYSAIGTSCSNVLLTLQPLGTDSK